MRIISRTCIAQDAVWIDPSNTSNNPQPKKSHTKNKYIESTKRYYISTTYQEMKPQTQIHQCDENPFIEFIAAIFKHKYDYHGELHNLQSLLEKLPEPEKEKCVKIQTLGVNDRQCPFIQDFHEAVDASDEFKKIYHAFIRKNVLPLFPKETTLVIQKTPNIRFSFPNSAAIGKRKEPNAQESESEIEKIGLHCDSDFGHHFTEMNFILPITPMYDSNSVYYEHVDDEQFQMYKNLKMLNPTSEFFQGYLNKLRHYNKINQTEHTRISFDVRIIPYSEYIEYLDTFHGTKFELGKYYVVLE